MNCKECKGTGKIEPLFSFVDCEACKPTPSHLIGNWTPPTGRRESAVPGVNFKARLGFHIGTTYVPFGYDVRYDSNPTMVRLRNDLLGALRRRGPRGYRFELFEEYSITMHELKDDTIVAYINVPNAFGANANTKPGEHWGVPVTKMWKDRWPELANNVAEINGAFWESKK